MGIGEVQNGPTVESFVRFREDLASGIGGMVDQAMFATCLSNDRRTAPTTTAIMSLLRTWFPDAATSAGTMKRAQLQMLTLSKISMRSRPVIRIFGRKNTRTLTFEVSRGPRTIFSLLMCSESNRRLATLLFGQETSSFERYERGQRRKVAERRRKITGSPVTT
jgi:hypothetical protein